MSDRSFYTVLLVVVICTILLRSNSSDSRWHQSAKPVAATPKKKEKLKFLTLRIDEIPPDHTKETLENELRSILQSITEADADLRQAIDLTVIVHSLERRTEDRLCSTTTFCTSISAIKLVAELRKAGQKYRYDYNCDFSGITPLYESLGTDENRVDLIAVPGLGSHALGSWRSPSSNDVWIRDYLPLDCPTIPVRVLLYGYDSSLKESSSKQSIKEMGQLLLESIIAFREKDGTEKRPVIFIGHSLGGLLVKEALVHAHQKHASRCNLPEACYGMLFFGVPHWGLRNEQLKSIVQGQPNESLISNLVVDLDSEPSAFLDRISAHFSELYCGKYRMVNFYERKESPTVQTLPDGTIQKTGPPQLLVTRGSATSAGSASSDGSVAIPLDANHSDLIKYDSRNNASYTIVSSYLKNLVVDARRDVPRKFAVHNLQEPHSDCTEECLRSLAFRGMDSRYEEIDDAKEGTCSWLFDHASFKEWLSQSRGLIWIKGKPGSGKSTLLKYALQNVTGVAGGQDGNPQVLSFFFHSRGSQLQNTELGLLRSLLHQILMKLPGALRVLTEAYEAESANKGHHGKMWEWSYKQLWDFLTTSLPQILEVYKVMIFVDALDEASEEIATEAVRSFTKLLESLPFTNNTLGIFFTCRNYPVLAYEYRLKISLDDENGPDIDTYIRQRLAEVPVISTERAAHLSAIVTKGAAGIFLWAHLVAEKVLKLERDWTPANTIEDEIQHTPQDLDQMYREIVKKMTGEPASIRLMQWLCCASQPLSAEELRWAMAINPGGQYKSLKECESSEYFIPLESMGERVNVLSCGLAEVVLSNQPVVQFIHHSVREFFLNEGLSSVEGSKRSPQVVVGEAHDLVFRCCVRYLVMDEIRHASKVSLERYYKGFPLLRYALFNAITHAQRAEALPGPISCFDPSFYRPPKLLFQTWMQSVVNAAPVFSSPIDEHVTPIQLAASQGLERSLSRILDELQSDPEKVTEIDKTDGSGNTPLAMASKAGHDGTVRRLLDTRAVSIESKNASGLTPLHLAADQGHEKIVRQLIDAGACINTLNDEEQSPLYCAIYSRQRSMIELMLNTGHVDINLQCRENRETTRYWTSLHLAIFKKDESTVGFLLAMPDVNVNIKDTVEGTTPLLLAVDCGYEEMVKLLIRAAGIDVNAPDDFGVTPLLRAVDSNHVPIINMLFTIPGVLVNSQNVNGETPLHWAADLGHVEIAEILLNQEDADVNVKDKSGRTPLHMAAKNPGSKVMQLLLSTGRVTIDAKDNGGRTSLFYAAEYRHNEAIKLLLGTRKADVNAQTNAGMTPLHIATMKPGREIAIQLLLGTGKADVNVQTNAGMAPLHIAAMKPGRKIAIQLLLGTGKADINSRSRTGLTPLHIASMNPGNEAAIQLLLNTEMIDINAEDNQGRTALFYADRSGHKEAVQILLRAGANPRNKIGMTLLHMASMTPGSEVAIQLLLDTGMIDSDAKDSQGRTALFCAADCGYKEAVELLLRIGKADINTQTNIQMTPLSQAAMLGHTAVVKILLETGRVDVNAPNLTGLRPLHWATLNGHKDIVLLLLDAENVDVEAKNKNGLTALYAAKKHERGEIEKLLLRYTTAE